MDYLSIKDLVSSSRKNKSAKYIKNNFAVSCLISKPNSTLQLKYIFKENLLSDLFIYNSFSTKEKTSIYLYIKDNYSQLKKY
jgi:hypothetical protein